MSRPIRDPKRYGWRARLAVWVLTLGCRHPEGVICEHRQFLYDEWLAGVNSTAVRR